MGCWMSVYCCTALYGLPVDSKTCPFQVPLPMLPFLRERASFSLIFLEPLGDQSSIHRIRRLLDRWRNWPHRCPKTAPFVLPHQLAPRVSLGSAGRFCFRNPGHAQFWTSMRSYLSLWGRDRWHCSGRWILRAATRTFALRKSQLLSMQSSRLFFGGLLGGVAVGCQAVTISYWNQHWIGDQLQRRLL